MYQNKTRQELLIIYSIIKELLIKQTKITNLIQIKYITNKIYYSLSFKSQIIIILYLLLIKYLEDNLHKLNIINHNKLNIQLRKCIKYYLNYKEY